MSYTQPRLGVFNATPFFFSQQPSRPIVISSLPGTRLNESVQYMVTSQKSAPKSVTQTTETKKPAADKEVIVLSSDSESDTETRRPVVSKKMKGKEKGNDSYVNEEMRNKTSEASASIIVSNSGISVVNDDCQYIDIDSLSNNVTISKATNKKNLLDDYALMSNKEKPSLFQLVNPVRIFLNILEDHKTNVGLFDIIVDFTRIYLEIYDEDKRIVTRLNDLRALVVDLIYCLMSKMKDDHYMATSKRFKQVELLAQKAIEIIERLKETGEILKRIEDYSKAQFHNERKRRNEEERSPQEEKRRKQDYDRIFVNEGEREEREQKEKEQKEREQKEREREEKRREYKRQEERRERRLHEERRLQEKEREKELVQIKWNELSMPAPSQFVPYDIPLSRPRKKTNGEAEFVELLAEPLHDLITTQVVYDLYRNFTPFRMSETVSKCSVGRIFRLNLFERRNYCKQLYRQYVNTNMDGTTKVLESWIKTRILENVKQR